MEKIGKYIYGIINSNSRLSGKVYTVSCQDISAVVSDSEIIDYTQMLKDSLARQLLYHQEVIEAIMPQYTILPMRLGMIASDGDEVKEILGKGYRLIKDIFEKIDNRIEIDVAVTWSDFALVIKEVGEDEEIKEFKKKILASPKGVIVDDQMKIGLMIKNHLERKRERYAFRIQTVLSKVSECVKTHELMDDKMVGNFAFLVDKQIQKDFYRKVEELNVEFAEKLNFRCIGPLPPYSFYTLEVKKMRFEEIDWARKNLGLMNDFATKDEIKKAHQAKAFSFHPDRNPDTADIEERFDEITKAYKILSEYCQGNSCFFRKEEVEKNALLIGIKE